MSIQRIRDNSQGLIAKVIVGAVALTFALFGVDAIIGFSSNDVDVASVNGEDIGELQLARTAEMYRSRLAAQFGDSLDPSLLDDQVIRSRALDDLIQQEVLLQGAQDQDLYVSSQRVDQTILQTEAFQADGNFSRDLYEIAVRNNGMTPLDYKTQLRKNLILRQPQIAISQSDFVTRKEIDQLVRLDRQKRNIAYLTLPVSNFLPDTDVSQNEIQEYYQANQAEFTTEEKVKISYLELMQSDFFDDVSVDEAEIQTRYQQEVQSYINREERHGAHILIEINDDRDADQARQEMEQILSKLQAGEEFAELAKQYSEDPGSAEAGGDLGFSERGVFAGPFEEALFALENAGDLSPVVETEFGLHLIKLLEVRKVEPPALEEIRETLVEELKRGKSEGLFISAIEELENDTFSSDDLKFAAENLDLELKTSEFFSASGGEGVTANNQVIRAAFSEDVLLRGNNSELIEITPEHVLVLRAAEHEPAAVLALEEVSAQIETKLKNQAASRLAARQGDEIVANLREGKTPAEITKDYEVEWTIQDEVSRNDSNLSSQIVSQAFEMPKPEVGGKSIANFALDNGDNVVLLLTRVYEEDTTGMEPQEITAIRQFLSNQFGSNTFQEYSKSLMEEATIKRY